MSTLTWIDTPARIVAEGFPTIDTLHADDLVVEVAPTRTEADIEWVTDNGDDSYTFEVTVYAGATSHTEFVTFKGSDYLRTPVVI